MPFPSHLISAEALSQRLQSADAAAALVVVDCRFDLANPAWGRQAYAASRIPGARYFSLDDDLSAAKTGRNGRHPLPTPEAFARTLGEAGIGNDSLVVAYDQDALMMASRLWWMLRWLGHGAVRVLDGGLAAWSAAGLPLETGAPAQLPPAKVFVPHVRNGLLLDAAQVQAALGTGEQLLVDARAAERYRGEVEPLDAVAGHIPGALNLPFTAQMEGSKLKPRAQLRETFEGLIGARPAEQVVHSCGSGVSATANILAMEEAGLSGSRLYAGSWSEWSSDPSRPVERG